VKLQPEAACDLQCPADFRSGLAALELGEEADADAAQGGSFRQRVSELIASATKFCAEISCRVDAHFVGLEADGLGWK